MRDKLRLIDVEYRLRPHRLGVKIVFKGGWAVMRLDGELLFSKVTDFSLVDTIDRLR